MEKTYKENVTIIGTQRGNIRAYINAKSLRKKVIWEESNGKWKMLECEYDDFINSISKQDRYNPRVRIFNISLEELVMEMNLRGIEVYNKMKRKGKLSDEAYEIVKLIEDLGKLNENK